jgi:hypothetical protein
MQTIECIEIVVLSRTSVFVQISSTSVSCFHCVSQNNCKEQFFLFMSLNDTAIRSRPTNFFHFPKGTYAVQVQERTLMVECFLPTQFYILIGVLCLAVLPDLFVFANVAKTPKEGCAWMVQNLKF